VRHAGAADPLNLLSAPQRAGSAGVHLKLIGMAALWGASWPAGRVLAQALPPLTGGAWRFALAMLLFALWWRLAGRGLAPLLALSRRQVLGLAAAGAVGVFGYTAFFMLGLQQVPASRAALIVTVNPVVTTLIAAWLFREKLDARIGIGMALAAIGASIVLTQGEPWRLFAGALGVGELMLLGCVACWVAYTLMGRRLLAGIDTLTTISTTAASGTLMLFAAALLVEGPAPLATPLAASPLVWAAMLFMAAGATVLAYAWYFDGVAALGAGGAAAYISLVPVFGVATSTLLLGEPLEPSLLLGGLLAVAGMAVMNQARR
jgi:drug/metabolite transporter (DMT)-like permease